ncbi:ChbG/HpnK family deacetylase [Miniimonas arenae]|uniref:ChbG/HpnK family deacetylase n=1 Tax=Miniimonas arenae TaxID=676201 RepID=A0A5C5B900_9MICO|nr:ChbG/HpnK family deacetylase [Miniimonas arenae]TNU72974.1 ChbG/HpnK family deacetylase [Miniimonas arenae]
MTERLLVVTADDLGLTRGVNAAVAHAHDEGVVTATSLLAVGRELDDAVAMLRSRPTLEVGAHLALVGEDPPVLSAREIPTLLDRRGRLPLSYRTVVRRGALGRIDPDDVRRELGAQVDRLLGAGLALTHLDTHQHTHLWPTVGTVVAELAARHRVRAVRLPTSHARSALGWGVRLMAARTRRRVTAAGLVGTHDYAGLDEAGAMDLDRLRAALAAARRRGAASLEVNAHPSLPDDPDLGRFAWGYAWGAELAALTDLRTRAEVARLGYRLGGFLDLPWPSRPATSAADDGTPPTCP